MFQVTTKDTKIIYLAPFPIFICTVVNPFLLVEFFVVCLLIYSQLFTDIFTLKYAYFFSSLLVHRIQP